MRKRLAIALPLVGALSSACLASPPGPRPPSYQADSRVLRLNPITVFQSSTGPVSQQTSTLQDVHGVLPTKRVQAEECQHGIQLPIGALVSANNSLYLSAGWGQGGYIKALGRAQERAEGGHLVDVRVDLRTISVLLGVYIEQCVVVDAGVVPAAALSGTIPTPPTTAPTTPPPAPSEQPPVPSEPPPIPVDADAGPPIQL